MEVIEARRLTRTYGEDACLVHALRGVDLTVTKGEFLAIMGPSGSGKSTLLHLLAGIETPTSGQIFLEGRDLSDMDDVARTLIRRQRIGLVFQSFNLLPAFTAEENVGMPLLLDGVSDAELRRRSEETLEQVGIAHRRRHLPGTLSGGEQQRVAIARALVIRPAILLADEPTGNLDTVSGAQITTLLRRLVNEQRQAVVMVTHDLTVAQRADRIVRLRDGQVEESAAPAESGETLAAGSLP
jgi:putative ABC transport system ATP-binding protein